MTQWYREFFNYFKVTRGARYYVEWEIHLRTTTQRLTSWIGIEAETFRLPGRGSNCELQVRKREARKRTYKYCNQRPQCEVVWSVTNLRETIRMALITQRQSATLDFFVSLCFRHQPLHNYWSFSYKLTHFVTVSCRLSPSTLADSLFLDGELNHATLFCPNHRRSIASDYSHQQSCQISSQIIFILGTSNHHSALIENKIFSHQSTLTHRISWTRFFHGASFICWGHWETNQLPSYYSISI